MKRNLIAFTIGIFVANCVAIKTTASATSYVVTTHMQQSNAVWLDFKKEQEEKIRKNVESIAELRKVKAKTDNKMADEMYVKRIDKLEERNSELATRLTNHKYEELKWLKFKREFMHDINELNLALKELSNGDAM